MVQGWGPNPSTCTHTWVLSWVLVLKYRLRKPHVSVLVLKYRSKVLEIQVFSGTLLFPSMAPLAQRDSRIPQVAAKRFSMLELVFTRWQHSLPVFGTCTRVQRKVLVLELKYRDAYLYLYLNLRVCAVLVLKYWYPVLTLTLLWSHGSLNCLNPTNGIQVERGPYNPLLALRDD
jgi:hypothetical protein